MKEIQILLVEDNEGDIVLTLESFAAAKISNGVIVARDGQEALKYLADNTALPDLILLDINLPKINGLEVLVAIKSDDRFKAIPVVMLTTSSSDRDVLNAYANHANCFINKPVDLNCFMEIIRSIESFGISIVKNYPTT